MIYLLINVLGCVTTTTFLNIVDRRNHSVLNKTRKRKTEVNKFHKFEKFPVLREFQWQFVNRTTHNLCPDPSLSSAMQAFRTPMTNDALSSDPDRCKEITAPSLLDQFIINILLAAFCRSSYWTCMPKRIHSSNPRSKLDDQKTELIAFAIVFTTLSLSGHSRTDVTRHPYPTDLDHYWRGGTPLEKSRRYQIGLP